MRVWDKFLSERDKQHLNTVKEPPRVGFGAKPALLLIDNYKAGLGEERLPLLESIKKYPLSMGEEAWNAVEQQKNLLQLCRQLGLPIIHTNLNFLEHAPLEFGLRITTLVRDTTEQAWADTEAKVARMAEGDRPGNPNRRAAVGQRRLLDLAARGDVLDDNLYTAPGRYGGGGAGTTWLVGSAEDVAKSLRRYQGLGITHFVLSDTPYLPEIQRQGERLLPLLRG